jgi:hypothetical protein
MSGRSGCIGGMTELLWNSESRKYHTKFPQTQGIKKRADRMVRPVPRRTAVDIEPEAFSRVRMMIGYFASVILMVREDTMPEVMPVAS